MTCAVQWGTPNQSQRRSRVTRELSEGPSEGLAADLILTDEFEAISTPVVMGRALRGADDEDEEQESPSWTSRPLMLLRERGFERVNDPRRKK